MRAPSSIATDTSGYGSDPQRHTVAQHLLTSAALKVHVLSWAAVTPCYPDRMKDCIPHSHTRKA